MSDLTLGCLLSLSLSVLVKVPSFLKKDSKNIPMIFQFDINRFVRKTILVGIFSFG